LEAVSRQLKITKSQRKPLWKAEMSYMLVKVRENEFKPLIDREGVVADVRKHLSPWIVLIEDVTNYGSNLIPRCFSSSPRGLRDTVVIAILLRQVVAMLDAIELLLTNGAVHSAQLQMRALFEASVYLDWILAGDGEKKSFYYYVHNLRRKRTWASRTQPSSPESQQFVALMAKSSVTISDTVVNSAKQQIQEIDRILSQPGFAAIDKEFNKHRKGCAWYVPLNKRTFREIALEVGKEAQYVVSYAAASQIMHTSSYDQHVKFGKGEVTFEPIRSIEGFENVLRFSLTDAFHTFRAVLKEYRPGEIQVFNRKYLEKWKREFMNFPSIKYEPITSKI
jgi:hypothetical protein